MLSQPLLQSHYQHLLLLPGTLSRQLQNPNFTLPPPPPPPHKCRPSSSVACASISQRHTYGKAVDYETTPMVNWRGLYRMIYDIDKPELGAGSVLTRCLASGRQPKKWELRKIISELRRFRRHRQALEVYEWMDNRRDVYRQTASDAAIYLDLIARVHGVSAAQRYFESIPSALEDGRIHGALLNVYVHARMVEDAENMFAIMREKGYIVNALTFNVMMTLYMKIKQYDKVEMLISEMIEKNIKFDIYSYNIWLATFGSQGLVEKMEQVFERMKLDKSSNPNWTTFSTMANLYINVGEIDKAEDCLRNLESRITGRDKIPYHFLLTHYGRCGNKEQVYRVWNTYKAVFPRIPNLGYHAMIASLVRLNDIEGAEKMYDGWLRVRSSYDPRVGNLLLGAYYRAGSIDKARRFFDHMTEVGGIPNSSTWEILGEICIKERRTREALSCFKEALGLVESKSWQIKPQIIPCFVSLCEEEGDTESKEVFLGLCKQAGYLEGEANESLISSSSSEEESLIGNDMSGDENDNVEETDVSEMLVNKL